MRKLKSCRELKVGGIYNRVYIGSNQVERALRGSTTLQVIKKRPELTTRDFFDKSGNPFSDKLESDFVNTYPKARAIFDEGKKRNQYEVFETESPDEYLIRAIKVTSFAAALEQKLITEQDIRDYGARQFWFIPTLQAGAGALLKGVHGVFHIKAPPEKPLLRSVIVLWPNWEEVDKDLAQYGVKRS